MKSSIIRRDHIHLLRVNGEDLPLYGYMSYQPAKACYRAFQQAGVRLFFMSVYAGDRGINQQSAIRPFRPGFWLGYDKYDFSHVDEDFRLVVGDSRPGEIYVIPRLMVEPPSWWDKANPDELCRDAQGTPIHHSYCSQKWREDTARMMEAFRDWLEESGWAQYVAGWHIACGNTEEFLRPQHHPMQFSDYSAVAEAAFREWLKGRYGSLEDLNFAWNRGYHSWDEVRQASPAQRMFSARGALRSEMTERQTMDTLRFINTVNAQAVVDLCASAKAVTAGQIVIGAFFGYIGMDADIGHVEANIVFESDAVDFLASPFTYTDFRAPGVDWTFPGCVASSMLHDKPWFVEADVRTCRSRPISEAMPFADPVVNRAYDGPVWTGPDTVEGSLGQMTRAFARVLTHNTAIWWFDMWGGWYDDPAFMDFHKQAADMYREHAFSGGSPCAAPVAVFFDDTVAYATTPGSGLSERIGGELRKELGYLGTPFRQFTFKDFEHVDPADFRMAIFPMTRYWSSEQLEALDKWKRAGRVLAFLGPHGNEEASGIDYVCSDDLETLPAEIERMDALQVPYIRYKACMGDTVLQRGTEGEPTALVRLFEDYTVFVSTALTLPAAMMRKLICAANGQVYDFDGDVVYASEKYLAVHAAKDGVKRICYPFRGRLVNALTGEALPGNECYAEVKMRLGETLLLEVQHD